MGTQAGAKPRNGLLNRSLQTPDEMTVARPAMRMIPKSRLPQKILRQQEDCIRP